MLDVYSVPNGVGIGRPPAKSLPSGAVWQAMQSPARARYSPSAISEESGCVGLASSPRAAKLASIDTPVSAAIERTLFRPDKRATRQVIAVHSRKKTAK